MTLKELDKLDLSALANEKVDVDILLNEDAVLDLSHAEKVVYRLFAKGATDRECSEQTGIPASTVTMMRYKFWERAERAVVFSLLAREMAKEMPPKKRKRKEENPGEYHPVINEKGIVISFARDKHMLHQEGEDALKHTSVIILVGWIDPHNNELSFFVVDKAGKMMTVNKESGQGYSHAWETCGGHTECQDSMAIEIGKPFPFEEAFYNATIREMKEELYIKRTKLDFDRLHFLFTDHYDGTTLPSGRNNEISGVFLYCFNGQMKKISSGDVRFRDQWRGAWLSDGLARKEWVARSRTLSELTEEYVRSPDHFCDGLARCIRAMNEDRLLVEKIKRLLK